MRINLNLPDGDRLRLSDADLTDEDGVAVWDGLVFGDYVLGRVWIVYGGALEVPAIDLSGDGQVEVKAEICAEIVDPPCSIPAWLAALPS